ncbi:MAG: YoaK family protein [Planctomycetota bacterium]
MTSSSGAGAHDGTATHRNFASRWSPSLVLVGGCWLALLAAAVNTHFLARTGVSVSHLTGDLARLGMQAVTTSGVGSREVAALSLSLLGFVGGAALAGFVNGDPMLSLQRPYGRSIVAIGLLVAAAWAVEPESTAAASFLVAVGCGFQNALASRYRGLVLRTTHVTGILTDVGQLVGMRARGHAVEPWKVLGQCAIVVAFLVGAVAGAWLELEAPSHALLVLGALYTASGLAWYVGKRLGRATTAA